MKRIFLITSVIVIFISCTKKSEITNPENVTIGTFNIEWLGDGFNDRKDRTEEDYRSIAEIILKSSCEILGIEEVENANAIQKLLNYLPDFKYSIGKSGGSQKIGVLYKNYIEISDIQEFDKLMVKEKRTKAGLLMSAKKGNFDFYLMVVHFKSTSHYDDTQEKLDESVYLRQQQASELNKWFEITLNSKKEHDLIVVGDFNDSPTRTKNPALTELMSNPRIIFITSELKSCKNHSWESIDQILVSNSAMKRLIPNSIGMFDFHSLLGKEKAGKISDHCPVYAKFDCLMPDND